MGKISQTEILTYCIQQGIPFAVYRLPHLQENVLIVSEHVKSVELESLFKQSEDCFVIAPFSLKDEAVISFKCDYVITETAEEEVFNQIKQINPPISQSFKAATYATWDGYQKQFEALHREIKKGKITKAILSRIKSIKEFTKDMAASFYRALCTSYPNAYTFMYFTPQTGLWTGASPELFFKTSDGIAKTVSLAGTRKGNGNENSAWGEKEVDEQNIVSDFVTHVLKSYGVQELEITGPETIKAGKMAHLRTSYTFSVQHLKDQIGAFVTALHPTPAVCGLPKDAAMEVIHQVESHSRSYYAGFLGRINKEEMDLFVNIRSMKFTDDGVDLYLGGGITLGSNAEQEWQETELKAETMQTVIQKVSGKTNDLNKIVNE